MPGHPKCFVAIGIAIAAMALSSFNAYQITKLNNEISALKSRTDLLVDISHLHLHLEEKTDATNKLVNYASDLFQVEVRPQDFAFTLIVHIPLVSNANLLELYEFLPLQIHSNFSSNGSITPDVGQNNLLAIGHSKSFQTISSSDLHSCLPSETPSFATEGK